VIPTNKFFAIAFQAALLLSACSGQSATVTEESYSDVYTAVAMTLAAQVTPGTPTTAPLQSPTSTQGSYPTSTPALLPTSTSSLVSSAVGCNNSSYISDVTIPDGTILAPGEAFTKTWRYQNSGSCAWDEDYIFTFVSGSDMNGDSTVIDDTVAVGGTADVSIELVAPSTAGTYTGYWRLADDAGTAFGQSVYVQIVVSGDASTLTPTSTSEPESTSTSTSTSAPTATSTTPPTETSVSPDVDEPETTGE
jgi:hypothetical protein